MVEESLNYNEDIISPKRLRTAFFLNGWIFNFHEFLQFNELCFSRIDSLSSSVRFLLTHQCLRSPSHFQEILLLLWRQREQRIRIWFYLKLNELYNRRLLETYPLCMFISCRALFWWNKVTKVINLVWAVWSGGRGQPDNCCSWINNGCSHSLS